MEYQSTNNLESILQKVNFIIKLPEDEKKRNNQILGAVLNQITDQLKKDPLFGNLYQKPYYGGSFYDGLKVAKPDEFDIDLLLKLPTNMKKSISNVNKGYVKLQLDLDTFRRSDQVDRFPNIEKKIMTGDCYLDNSKVRRWFEGLIQKVLNKTSVFNYEEEWVYFKLCRKSGPAFTLDISTADYSVSLNVDLVPTFIIDEKNWPENFLPNIEHSSNDDLNSFFLVPKPFINDNNCYDDGDEDSKLPSNYHWRPSFQKQEKALLNGKYSLKPAIRLIKKFRDNTNKKFIHSYYIKTVGLLMLEDMYGWNIPLSDAFMMILDKLCDCLENKKIPFYWNRETNLFSKVNDDTFVNCVNYMRRMIKQIKKDPQLVLDYLLSQEEKERYNQLGLAESEEPGLSNAAAVTAGSYSQSDLWDTSNDSSSDDSSNDNYTNYVNSSRYENPRSTGLAQNEEPALSDAAIVGISVGIGALAIGGALLWRTLRNRRE